MVKVITEVQIKKFQRRENLFRNMAQNGTKKNNEKQ